MLKCATTDIAFKDGINAIFYNDPVVMMNNFCKGRQDSNLCCDFTWNTPCTIELEYKKTDTWNINLEKMPYGTTCTYQVTSDQGYPDLKVNNTHVDMVVAYKKD